jgi:hypothetical protein
MFHQEFYIDGYINMFAVIYFRDGSSSNYIYPVNGVSFGQNELASKDKKIARVMIYGA